jgi:hypothetical protein
MSQQRSMNSRDATQATLAILSSGEYPLSSSARSVLWFWHMMMWTDPRSEWFGHVDIRYTATSIVIAATGLSRSTVRRAVAQLAAEGFIQRKTRYVGRLRVNDDIAMVTPGDWNRCCGRRGNHSPGCEGFVQFGGVTMNPV